MSLPVLGRKVEHDPRSRDYQAALAGGPLVSTEWKRSGSVFDQGQLGSCTGNAIAGSCNTAPIRHRFARLKTEADAVKAYSLATRLDGDPGQYPPDDTGSSGLAACKAAVQLGWISAYHHAFGLDQALRALMVSPVITGTNWYDSFDRPINGVISISPNASIRGGHEYEVIGLDVEHRLVHAVNSWGPGYGVNGHMWLSFDTWGRLLSEQGDVTVSVR